MNAAALDQGLREACLARLHADLRTLPDKPEETPESTLAALWHAAAGQPVSAEAAPTLALPRLDAMTARRLHELVDQRLSGTPLAHLTGRQRFMGLEMLAGPQALIPRRETELLARRGFALLARRERGAGAPLVLDACTGSANVAAALAALVPSARVLASDLSADAVALARENLAHLGLADRVQVLEGDLLGAFDAPAFVGRVDLITCNPPYISAPRRGTMDSEIAGHEPSLAFDGGPLGVSILMRLIRESPRFLKSGGWLAFEVGAGQGTPMRKRLLATGDWSEVATDADEHGEIRVLSAQRA